MRLEETGKAPCGKWDEGVDWEGRRDDKDKDAAGQRHLATQRGMRSLYSAADPPGAKPGRGL